MAQGLINNGVSVTKSFSPNQLELLADYTVSGSAITSYTFSGLKLNADEEIVLVSDIINSSSNDYHLLVNGITDITKYYRQYLQVSNTSFASNRVNDASFSYENNNKGSIKTNIKLTNNGYFTFISSQIQDYGTTSPIILLMNGTSIFTISQITSLTVLASTASGIGIGSRFQLYKVKGQVQQTWATT